MSESCEKALEALKSLLTDPDSYEPFCIGTSEMFWKRIESEGLQPSVCTMSGQCTDTSYEDISGRVLNRVWFGRKGNKLCSTYARRAVKRSAGKPLNITFNAQLTQDGMRESKQYAERGGFISDSVDLSDIPNANPLLEQAKSACSAEVLKEMLENLPDWTKSMIAQKSANFVSMIRVNPISIENIDETEPVSEIWND